MYIYIDTETGAYGVADELYIVLVNEGAEIGDLLDGLCDAEIGTLGKAVGRKVLDHIYH